MDRRDFIKLLGASGATLFVPLGGGIASAKEPPPGVDPARIVWDKAPCRYCGAGCGVEVGVLDGRVVAVRGDEKNPVNRGTLCAKGYHLPAMLSAKDRLTHPLRRVPGTKKFERIPWDDALDLVAENVVFKRGVEDVDAIGYGCWGEDGTSASPAAAAARYGFKDKGVHFYKAKGYGEKAAVWLRLWHPPAESPDDEFPFCLATGRVLEHWRTGSMTRRVKTLHRAVPEAYVELNAEDAARLGVEDGTPVRLSSRRGARRTRPGAPPAMPHRLLLRENCLACHGEGGPPSAPRTTHPERERCRQCHVEVRTDGSFRR